MIQRYDLIRETTNKKGKVKSKTVGKNLPVAPPNIGPKTFPNYQSFVDGATTTLNDGTKAFAGSRDDPFFVDLGATFDAINVRMGTGNEGQGKDDLSGYSTSATVLQIPERLVTNDGQAVSSESASNSVVGVWATTERRKLEVTNADFDVQTGGKVGKTGKDGKKAKNSFVQVSRLGNPLINEVVIPLGKKDQFNRTTPDKDAAKYGKYVTTPELAAVLNALFDINAPETDRTDIVQALLQGIPGLNEHPGKNAATPVDTIKINLGTPPNPSPSRFGVIGGDTAGFPNGRRLEDDVVDIELQVVAGFLVGNEVPLGDGVDENDKPFLPMFPYLAAPDSGFDSNPGQVIQPAHPPTPAGGTVGQTDAEGEPPRVPGGSPLRERKEIHFMNPTLPIRPDRLFRWLAPALVFAACWPCWPRSTARHRRRRPAPAARRRRERRHRHPLAGRQSPSSACRRPSRCRGLDLAGQRLLPARPRDRRLLASTPAPTTPSCGRSATSRTRPPRRRIAGQATIALARHDFAGGLELAPARARSRRLLAPLPLSSTPRSSWADTARPRRRSIACSA